MSIGKWMYVHVIRIKFIIINTITDEQAKFKFG